MRRFTRQLIALFRRSRLDRELDDEIAAHLEMAAADHVARGMAPEDARAAARRSFGGVAQAKEAYRDHRGFMVLDTAQRELRQAFRGLRRAPVFSAVAVVSLAVAIGANTAVFSLLDALLLRPLPVRSPGTLVRLSTVAPDAGYEAGLTFAIYQALTERQREFSAVIGLADDVRVVDANGERVRAEVSFVSGNYFAELGIRPAAGRLLGTDDVNEATLRPSRAVVIGYEFWRVHLAGNASAVGSTLSVDGQPFTIVGIAPKGFRGLTLDTEPAVTLPLTAVTFFSAKPASAMRSSASPWVRTVGRMRPGVSLDVARAALKAWWPAVLRTTAPARLSPAERDRFLATRLVVASASRGVVPGVDRLTRPLRVVLAIAALILLVAIANLAALVVARTAARSREFGIRLALGSGGWAIARHVAVENLVVSTAGAAIGSVFAYWIGRAIVAIVYAEYTVPASLDVAPDMRIIAFASALAIAAAALMSAVPAWLAVRQNSTVLIDRAGSTSTASARAGRWLVMAQIAIALVLAVDGGLLVRTLQEIRAVGSGMSARGVLVAYPSPRPGGYDHLDNDEYYPALVASLAAIPGVSHIALALSKPAGGNTDDGERVSPVDAPMNAVGTPAPLMAASPGLFDTLGIRLDGGRDFTWADNSRGRPVAIVSQTLARHLFGHSVATGRHIRIGAAPARRDVEIVGIAADAHLFDLRSSNLAVVYVPALQDPNANWKCVIARGAAVSTAALNRVVESFGHDHIWESQTLDDITDRVLLTERMTAFVGGSFGAFGLFLTAIGVYGLIGYTVSQRSREIGVRMALGATGARVVRHIAADAMAVASGGVLLGMAAALVSVRIVGSLLFGVTTHDPMTLVAAPAVLFAATLVACAIPAWRAARIDPAVAFRAE